MALPDPRLSPGQVVAGVGVDQLCRRGYAASARKVSSREKTAVYRRYGITRHPRGMYEVDHLIPLELGGSNDVTNLWPEPYAGIGAHQKDHLEDYLHNQVCAGRESLSRAQHDIATDWYAAWVAAGRP